MLPLGHLQSQKKEGDKTRRRGHRKHQMNTNGVWKVLGKRTVALGYKRRVKSQEKKKSKGKEDTMAEGAKVGTKGGGKRDEKVIKGKRFKGRKGLKGQKVRRGLKTYERSDETTVQRKFS